MKRLGIVAEVNLGSNAVSGSLQDHPTTRQGRDSSGKLHHLDDSSLLELAVVGVPFVLGPDSQAVMGKSLAVEYRNVRKIFDQFREAAGSARTFELGYSELPERSRRTVDEAYTRLMREAGRRQLDVDIGDVADNRQTARP